MDNTGGVYCLRCPDVHAWGAIHTLHWVFRERHTIFCGFGSRSGLTSKGLWFILALLTVRRAHDCLPFELLLLKGKGISSCRERSG